MNNQERQQEPGPGDGPNGGGVAPGALAGGAPEFPPVSTRTSLWAGLSAGFALIAVAAGWPMVDVTGHPFRWLLLSAGVAAIIGAVGGLAAVRLSGTGQALTAGGAAAIMFGIALWLQPAGTPSIEVDIRGTEGLDQMIVKADANLFSGRPDPESHWRFLANREQLKAEYFIIIGSRSGSRIIIGCIPTRILHEAMAPPGRLDLALIDIEEPAPAAGAPPLSRTRVSYRLVRTGRDVTPVGEAGQPTCPPATTTPPATTRAQTGSLPFLGSLVLRPAYADIAPSWPVSRQMQALSSGRLDSELTAQTQIAGLRSAPAIAQLMAAWIPEQTPRRAETGLVVGLVAGIRANRVVAAHVANALTDAQLRSVIAMAGDLDQTNRYNATELLGWILDSTAWSAGPRDEARERIFERILSAIRAPERHVGSPEWRADPGNLVYNTLVAVQQSKCDMRPQDRPAFDRTLLEFATSRRADAPRSATLAEQTARLTCRS